MKRPWTEPTEETALLLLLLLQHHSQPQSLSSSDGTTTRIVSTSSSKSFHSAGSTSASHSHRQYDYYAAEIAPHHGEADGKVTRGSVRDGSKGVEDRDVIRLVSALLVAVALAVTAVFSLGGTAMGTVGSTGVLEPVDLVVVPHSSSLSDWGGGVLGEAPSKARAEPLLGAAHATDHPSFISFQELARSMVPSLYRSMCQQAVPVLTDDVPPADVYNSRKLILKTRDLLDVFSPVYPNATAVLLPSSSPTVPTTPDGPSDKVPDDGTDGAAPVVVDLWGLVRDLLDRGYEVIGEFQDIDHAHIRYTPEMFDAARGTVLEWRRDFERFHRQHGYDSILAFLQSPSPDSFRHRESRLFWKTIEALPAGSDGASASLHVLGSRQTATALVYLKLAFQYDSVLGTVAHEHYHNLRKELRSMTDEYDVLGVSMFPKSCLPSIKLFKTARTILGDINDMWTAYDAYLTHKMHRSDEERLAKEIDRAWQSFRIWVEENDFEGAIRNVTLSMRHDFPAPDDDSYPATTAQPLESVVAPAQEENVPTLQDFLLERKQDPTNSVVIGNEAGDADTIVTSLVLAYVESVQAGANKTPVVAIDRLDLDTQRPEVSFLFKLAGISSDDVLCVDDPYVESLQVAAVTLTDHNRLAPALQYRRNWTVIEIVDHHQDEGEYTATCSGESRTIAFAEGKALVASACTLVAERLFELWKPPSGLFPGSVGVLLLGVILLDSVGLSEEVGKVTQRDRDAVQRLISRTDWDELPDASKQTLRLASASSAPDPMALFDLLQDSKYDTGFWNSLNVRDSLRQDYKSFPCTNGFEFGISSVLMPAQLFLSKEHVVDGVLDYMADSNVTFLAIMFAFQDEQRRLHRQLAFCSTDNDPSRLDALVTHLESSPPPQGEDNSLDLRELGPLEDAAMISQPRHSPVLWFRVFEQRNAVPSRKQVGPILEELFESPS